ncbi:sugar phosphate isomerase/epimerase family protein [Cohnella soli]|uniref:Sugar phosphate isomerase/epimerase family protein n=1 Tax=Cohnella soli TaxID=425005 RepID=A0ABW0HQ32_9BACL
MKHKFAIQLFTLRQQCEKDMPGTLRELKRMGWAGVETAGLHGYSAEEIAETLRETGLKTAGMHVSLERLRDETDSVMKEAKLLNTNYLICPSVPHEWRNEWGYERLRAELNAIAAKVQPEGFAVGFHNHAFEFDTRVSDTDALTYVLEPSPDNAVLAEIDVYWITKAGKDPTTFLHPYSGRAPTLHLKDMTRDERRTYAEIGTGAIDFVPILRWGESNGVEWYVVEQDQCEGDALDSARISLANLYELADRERDLSD